VTFSDNSAEFLIDRVGANGLLDVGDSLRGIFSVDNITGSGPQIGIGTGTAIDELTGLFQVVVTSKTATPTPGVFNYTFGFDNTFGQGANVAVVLFDDPAQDFARLNCATFATCEATATGGSIWATLGFGATSFWSASGARENPGVGATLPFATPLGTFGIGLDFVTNNTGFTWNHVDCIDTTDLSSLVVDLCGQGGILATGRTRPGQMTNTPYDIFDNVDFTMNRVPEPGSLALVSLALLGLGGFSRARRRS
jgi:hypothetical protein